MAIELYIDGGKTSGVTINGTVLDSLYINNVVLTPTVNDRSGYLTTSYTREGYDNEIGFMAGLDHVDIYAGIVFDPYTEDILAENIDYEYDFSTKYRFEFLKGIDKGVITTRTASGTQNYSTTLLGYNNVRWNNSIPISMPIAGSARVFFRGCSVVDREESDNPEADMYYYGMEPWDMLVFSGALISSGGPISRKSYLPAGWYFATWKANSDNTSIYFVAIYEVDGEDTNTGGSSYLQANVSSFASSQNSYFAYGHLYISHLRPA